MPSASGRAAAPPLTRANVRARLDELLLRVLDVARPVDSPPSSPASPQIAAFSDSASPSSSCASATSRRWTARIELAHGADQLARPAQRLLARRVLALQLGARPAFDRLELEALMRTTRSPAACCPCPCSRCPAMRTCPTSRVLATCVPPSACWSMPSMLTTRICSMPSGSRLTLVRIRSGICERFGARQNPNRAPDGLRPAARSSLLDRLQPLGGQVRQQEVHPRAIGVHLAAGDRRAVQLIDHAAHRVQRRVVAHQRVAAIPVDLAVDRGVHAAAAHPRSGAARAALSCAPRQPAPSRRAQVSVPRSCGWPPPVG